MVNKASYLFSKCSQSRGQWPGEAAPSSFASRNGLDAPVAVIRADCDKGSFASPLGDDDGLLSLVLRFVVVVRFAISLTDAVQNFVGSLSRNVRVGWRAAAGPAYLAAERRPALAARR
jgi:hypothetical protein